MNGTCKGKWERKETNTMRRMGVYERGRRKEREGDGLQRGFRRREKEKSEKRKGNQNCPSTRPHPTVLPSNHHRRSSSSSSSMRRSFALRSHGAALLLELDIEAVAARDARLIRSDDGGRGSPVVSLLSLESSSEVACRGLDDCLSGRGSKVRRSGEA